MRADRHSAWTELGEELAEWLGIILPVGALVAMLILLDLLARVLR